MIITVISLSKSNRIGFFESIEVFKEGIELSKYLEEKLSSIENKAIKLFENNELKDLEMKNARFSISVEFSKESNFNVNGLDKVEFVIVEIS